MTTLNSRLQLALLNRKKGRNLLEKGFTLVELLIVIVIVGVLSAVALPNFLNQADKARASAADAAVKSAANSCAALLVTGEQGSFALPNGVTYKTGTTACADNAVFISDATNDAYKNLKSQAEATVSGTSVTLTAATTN